ncbi:MAG: MarR family transcriptional regulator, partial [Chloroflexi bacterium]
MPRFGRVAWHAAQECGMTSPERGRLLWAISDKSVRAGLVAQHLKLSAGAVTELVESLVREGLVRRETDPDDRRAV